MKKTMIFTLILMPLIVLGILLLSGNIVNLSTYLYVEYIEFVDDEIVLQKDTEANVFGEVKVNVFPLLANNRAVEFWSDDESIVTVDSEGKIVGVNFGETYIHAKSKENATKTSYCRVRVTSNKVHSITLSETQKSMYVGDTHMLRVGYTPTSAVDTALDYSSSDTDVATVAQNGEITIVGSGNVTITAWLRSNPNLRVSLRISAKPRVSKMEIESGRGADEYSSKVNFTFPNVVLYPSGASENILYRVTDLTGENVASVDANGIVVFNKAGSVNVTAYIDGTNFAVTKKYTSTFDKFSAINFSIDSPTSIDYADYENGRELVLRYSFAPLDMDESKLSISITDESGAPSEVIKLEDGKLKVKRGGKATITISGAGENGIVSASSTITVNRTATIIGFEGSGFEGGATFAYVGKDGVALDASGLPKDANDEIRYSLSDESVARIENGKLYFSKTTISLGYGKVFVTAYTDMGVSSSVAVMYLDESIEKLDANSDFDSNNTISLNMPKSGEGVRKFALIDDNGKNFDDIQFVLSENLVLEQLGESPIFTLRDKGSTTITINYIKNDLVVSSKMVTIVVYRLVESIENIKVKAIWEDCSRDFANTLSEVYSSATEFEISYALLPTSASLDVATLSIVESSKAGVAELRGHKLKFNGIGKVTITISADGVNRSVTIVSTYLHPDNTTKLNLTDNTIEMSHDNEDSINLFDYITMLENVDKAYITFVLEGTSVSIQNGIVSTNHGGGSEISVYANIGGAEAFYVGKIVVNVVETAKNTIVTSNQYFFTDSRTFDISSLFAFAPATANEGTRLYYSASDGATLNGSRLSFATAGKYTITARLNGQSDGAKITIVYTGASTVLTQKNVVIIKGTTVMLKPSNEALASASFDQEFLSSTNDIVVTGASVTVNGSGKVVFGDEEFKFVCLGKNEITLAPKNESDYTYVDQKYETGLRSVELMPSHTGDGNLDEYITNGYAFLDYAIDGGGSVESGVANFSNAGTYNIALILTYSSDVVGRYEKSTTIRISTTYGVANITKKLSEGLTKVFDENNLDANHIDLKKYLNISPKPFVLDTSVLGVSITSATQNIATVDGLDIRFACGGTFDVKIENKTNPDNTITLSFVVNRSATGISLDGMLLNEQDIVVGSRATIYVNPIAMPLDSNINRGIIWEITKDENSVAKCPSTNDRIVFSRANEEIEVTFTLESGKTFVVKYKTTNIMYEVDLDESTIIAPMKEPFTFVSTSGRLDPSKIVFTGTVDGVLREYDENGVVYYKFEKSFNKLVNISYDGFQIERRIVSVSEKQDILSSDITIDDKDKDGKDVSKIPTTSTAHITASKSIKLNIASLDEYGADGNKLTFEFSSSDRAIADVESGVVLFKKAGSVRITASITYYILPISNVSPAGLESQFEKKVLTYSFVITSTYGSVTDFEGVTDTYALLYDTMENGSIDLLSGIRRTAPNYGIADSVPRVLVSGKCVEWDGNILKVADSGSATVKVIFGTMQKDVSVSVDKYIDTISILERSTERAISKVVTKSSEYSFNYALSGFKTPTLLDLYVDIKIDGESKDSDAYITLENGVAKVSGLQSGHNYELTLTAKDGGATSVLRIVAISEDVNIIDLSDGNNRSVILTSGGKYIFENKYNNHIYTISNHNSNISIDPVGVFSARVGDESIITLSASGASDIIVKYIATENVREIVLGENAWEDNYLTSKGSKDDGTGIDLMIEYSPIILPTTARTYTTIDGDIASHKYGIKFEIVDGENIAYIENGILYFNAQGVVTIKISSTDEDAREIYLTRKIKSTLGYYSSLVASVAFDGEEKNDFTFNYAEGGKSPRITYTYLPVDIDTNSSKTKINVISTDDSVLEWKNNSCVFVGGGKANLKFEYFTSATEMMTQEFEIYVINKATSVALTVCGVETNYLVTTYGENEILSLDYIVLNENGARLSKYNTVFHSSNESVAMVDENGKVTFKGDGQVTIAIKVASEKNAVGEYDVTDTITIVNNKDYEVLRLDLEIVGDEESDNGVTQNLKVDSLNNYVLYPTSSACYTAYHFEIVDNEQGGMSKGVSENDIASINEVGEITLKGKGGYFDIKISATRKNGKVDTFTLTFYAWKRATIALEENNIDTSKTEWQIEPIINTADGSMENKTIEYMVINGIALVDKDGKVAFGENSGSTTGEGYAEVRVSVMYNGKEEVGDTFKITTTYGKARSFKLYKVLGETSEEVVNNDNVELKTKGKLNATFEVRDVLPSDAITLLEITTDGSGAYEYVANGNTLVLYGKRAITSGSIQLGVSGSSKMTLNIEVIQLAQKIDITLDGNVITNKTNSMFASTIKLSYALDSVDVSDQSAIWEIVSGNNIASLSISGKVCTLTLSGTDEVVLKVTSGDSECSATATFKMTDITGFGLDASAYSIINNEIKKTYNGYIYIGADEQDKNNVTLKVKLNEEIVGFDGWRYFSYSKDNGTNWTTLTVNGNTGAFTIPLNPFAIKPEICENVTIRYANPQSKNVYTQTIGIYRDGISAVEFKYGNVIMDETLTQSAGLQQMLVFGNQSYYDGVKNYYNMTVETTPLAKTTNNLSGDGIVWKVVKADGSTLNVGINYTIGNANNDTGVFVGNAQITTNALPMASIQNMYDDNFTSGEITLTAFNLIGTKLSSYTFHFVQGVNVWDANGYLNGGENVVLHHNLGHTDEYSTDCKYFLGGYSEKTAVYGNGHLLSLGARNADSSAKTSWGYIAVKMTNTINTVLKGANAKDSSYYTELSGPQTIAYCEMYNMYRAVEIGGGNIYIKNTLFRNFAHSTINASNECATERNIYLKNVIMFDVGQRAIELQSQYDRVHITGILDVYNFQDEDALGDAISSFGGSVVSGAILDLAEEEKLTVEKFTKYKNTLFTQGWVKELWSNIFCLGTKGAGKGAKVIWYENGFDQAGVETMPCMGKVAKPYVSTTYLAWAFKNDHTITWEDEFVEDYTAEPVKRTDMTRFNDKLYRIIKTTNTII